MSAGEPASQDAVALSKTSDPSWVSGDGLSPGDAYMEGEFLVFTAQFHLRRGYCCNSACRHCPYREG